APESDVAESSAPEASRGRNLATDVPEDRSDTMGRRHHVPDGARRMDRPADGPQTLSEERPGPPSPRIRSGGRSGEGRRPRRRPSRIRMTRITRDYVVQGREWPTVLRNPMQGGPERNRLATADLSM